MSYFVFKRYFNLFLQIEFALKKISDRRQPGNLLAAMGRVRRSLAVARSVDLRISMRQRKKKGFSAKGGAQVYRLETLAGPIQYHCSSLFFSTPFNIFAFFCLSPLDLRSHSRLFSPFPTTVRALHFYRKNTSALSSLVE